MAWTRYIPEIFDSIVSDIRAEYDPTNGLEPYFDYGHVQDMLRKLTAKDDAQDERKFQKYPLIALILDQEEDHDTDINTDFSFDPTLIIVNQTKEEYTSQNRDSINFHPILYPLYDLLIEKVRDYKYFLHQSSVLIPHKKWDRYTWGASGAFGNVGVAFNDHLDGIEVKFSELSLRKQRTKCSGYS